MSFHFKSALLPDGWANNVRVEIAGGRFVSVERDCELQATDESVPLVLPGMSNVHSHGFQRGMAGLTEFRGPEADNFWSWRSLMYRFVGRMTPDDIGAITAQAYIEMLEAGFTRVAEFHYVHNDPAGKPYDNPAETAIHVAAAVARTGIGLTLLPVFYAHSGFGGAKPNDGQRRFDTSLDEFARLMEAGRKIVGSLEGANLGVAPHSLRAVTPDELARVVPLAGPGPVHIHAAEQIGEVEQCVAWSGARPVQWLLDHADVDRRWCLIHATHMDSSEIGRLAASGAVAGFCPITEANLGDGISPAAPYIRENGAFGIGTDSNVLISVSEELRQLEYGQRLRERARNVISREGMQSTGRVLFEGALLGGARATGQVAGIVAGASADFFSLDPDAASLVSRSGDAVLDSFVFGGDRGAVDRVWCAGRKLVEQGRHQARSTIETNYRRALARLL